ncbi:MAG: hypothetical protein IJR59_05015 [Firmicutes bacterium]|nr:hypothetical protein [Bacillota bacterium]
MRRNTFFKLLLGFVAGLIICGVGVGVFLMEITSLEVVRADDEVCKTEREYKLPQGKKLYIDGWSSNVYTIEDESIPAGTMKCVVEHGESTQVNFWEIENMYLCELNENDDDWDYDWDEDYEKEQSVRHRVQGLWMPDISIGDEDDWNEFRKMLDSLKEKKVYIPGENIRINLYLNPADAGQVVCLWKHGEEEVWLENGEVYEDDVNAVAEEEINVVETTAENTTVEITTQPADEVTTAAETAVQPTTAAPAPAARPAAR